MFGIATQLVDALVPPTGAVPSPAAAAAAASAPARHAIADDDFVTGAQMRELMARTPNHAAETAVEMAASSMLGLARQQFPQDFAKYGPEISQKLANVPRHLWTLDNLSTVVKLVRSDHLDEIVSERATQLAAGAPGTIRSGGGIPAATVVREHSLESEKIPAEWKRRAQAAGVTERVVEEFCRANDGMTPEAFYKQFDTPLNRIVEDIPQRKSV